MGKSTYRTDNWKEYNQSLINRGSLTFWIDKEAISGWLCSEHHGNRGRGNQYSDTAIMTALMVKRLFNLSLRAVQGFMNSVFSLMKVPLTCPNYSSISKRAKTV
ncbi:transposase, partial [Photobacterium sp. MCCC 1A19761]|uniref:transposase n=1 Tax=Photobacterium sp. MCCC 1A19761 TaxID=3115000 RepID=UPI00307DE6DD